MHWLDTVLAVPLLGVQSKTDAAFGLSLSSAAAPLAALLQEKEQLAQITPEAARVMLEATDGRRFVVTPSELVVQFGYTIATTRPAGALPELAPTEVRPFSDVLQDVREGIFDALQTVWVEGREVSRIGLLATVHLRHDHPPPGIARLIEAMGQPWSGPLLKCQSTLLAVLADTDVHRDQCHHGMAFDLAGPDFTENEDAEVTLTLDWQRVFKRPESVLPEAIERSLDDCMQAALRYFADLGEGSLQ